VSQHCVICCFPALNFVKICLPKRKWCPQIKVKINVPNLRDKVKIWDLLKGSTSLVEVGQHYGKNESSSRSTALNAMYPEHAPFVLSGGLLGTRLPQIPRLYCTIMWLLEPFLLGKERWKVLHKVSQFIRCEGGTGTKSSMFKFSEQNAAHSFDILGEWPIGHSTGNYFCSLYVIEMLLLRHQESCGSLVWWYKPIIPAADASPGNVSTQTNQLKKKTKKTQKDWGHGISTERLPSMQGDQALSYALCTHLMPLFFIMTQQVSMIIPRDLWQRRKMKRLGNFSPNIADEWLSQDMNC
jgi:hypothetical protein